MSIDIKKSANQTLPIIREDSSKKSNTYYHKRIYSQKQISLRSIKDISQQNNSSIGKIQNSVVIDGQQEKSLLSMSEFNADPVHDSTQIGKYLQILSNFFQERKDFEKKVYYAFNQVLNHITNSDKLLCLKFRQLYNSSQINQYVQISSNKKDDIIQQTTSDIIQQRAQNKILENIIKENDNKVLALQNQINNLKIEIKRLQTINNAQQQFIISGSSSKNECTPRQIGADLPQQQQRKSQNQVIIQNGIMLNRLSISKPKQDSKKGSLKFDPSSPSWGKKSQFNQLGSPYLNRREQQTNTQIYKEDFIQHQSDFSFIVTLLNVSLSDEIIRHQYFDNFNIKFLNQHFESEDFFKAFLERIENRQQFIKFYESISLLQKHNELQVNLILKLKRLILEFSTLKMEMDISGAFQQIVAICCQILHCDRASVYLIDLNKNEIWTKVAKGTKAIRLKLGEGIAGFVAINGNLLNILDPQLDSRFNKNIDIANNYKTKNILCAPIYDDDQKSIIGVLQAINKIDNAFFTKDDEAIITILAKIANLVMKNQVYLDDRLEVQHSLKVLYSIGLQLSSCQSIQQVLLKSESLVKEQLEIPEIKIFYYDAKLNKLIRCFNGGENGQQCQTEQFYSDIGIVGQVFTEKRLLHLENCYNYINYNNKIDLDTSLPIICLPINPEKESSNIKGVIQVINKRKVNQSSLNNRCNVDSLSYSFKETLKSLSYMLAEMIENVEQRGSKSLE